MIGFQQWFGLPMVVGLLTLGVACGDRPEAETMSMANNPPETVGSPADDGATAPPSAAGETPETSEQTETAIAQLVISGGGLQTINPDNGSTTVFDFGTDQARLTEVLTTVTGTAIDESLNEECPPGPLFSITWANGLMTYFQDGQFVGWMFSDETSDLSTMAGITTGSSLAELEAVYNLDVFEDSLGVEFYTGTLSGLLTANQPDGQVTHLWAGMVCIFR